MKYIQLTQGKQAIVDDKDYEVLSQYMWRYNYGSQGGEYAVTNQLPGGSTVRMHRYLLGAMGDQEVDHINGNGLDNRRENLRFVNKEQQNRNRRIRKDNQSGYIGVYLQKNGKYRAQLKINKKSLNLGEYATAHAAAKRYNTFAHAIFGEYAVLNKL